jgi:hypothetical protein
MMIQWLKRKWLHSSIFLVLSTLIILSGAGLTLLWQVQQRTSSRADSGTIAGPPSLPAATVDAIFARVGSPMVGTGKVVEQASRQTNIDDAFALGVWWAETNDGMAGVGRGDRNPGSVRGSPGYPTASDSYTFYPSYAVAVTDWFNILKSRYISRGLTSVYTICYPYVSTSNAPNWAAKVVSFMNLYRGEAPPPRPTAVPPHPIPSHKPFSIGVTGQQRTLGFTEEEHRGVVLRATPDQNGQAQQHMPHTLSAANQLFLVVCGLLAALALALVAFRIRRNIPIIAALPFVPATPALSTNGLVEPITPPLFVNEYSPIMPPLFVNEYSPVKEPSTTSLLPPSWAQWEQGWEVREAQEVFAVSSTPATSSSSRAGISSPNERFNHHGRREFARPRRISLRPSEPVEAWEHAPGGTPPFGEPLANQPISFGEPFANQHALSQGSGRRANTDAIPYRLPGIVLPNRQPQPVGARPAGLLSRYSQGDTNEKS